MAPSNMPTSAIELEPRHSLRQRARRLADAHVPPPRLDAVRGGRKEDGRYPCLHNCPLEVLKMANITTTARTSYGSVRGVAEEGLVIFRGIPYARPPGGDRGSGPRLPPDGWTGTRDATTFGPRAMQPPVAASPGPNT